MLAYVAIALAGGACVAMGRSINARLSEDTNAFTASFWNHAGGALFLLLIIPLFEGIDITRLVNTPVWTLSGGIIGAVFVAISSYVFPRLGATRSALLIIGGQMACGLMIDMVIAGARFGGLHMLGLGLILAGLVIARLRG